MFKFQLSFEAIGTHWVIDCFNANKNKKEISELIKKRIEVFDKTYSRFRTDSVIWEISKKAGNYNFPEDSSKLFDNYKKFYKITNGYLTPIVGNALDEAGYDKDYSLRPGKINKVPDLDSVYDWSYPELLVKKPCIIDFGALGKGYLIDIISDLLKENGVKSFIVDAGGDIKCEGLSEKLRIGMENPKNFEQAIGIIEMNDVSVCASSGSRRKWGSFHHILNPKTLKPVDNVLATWVISKETIIADGVATALFFQEPKILLKYYDFEYFILYPDFKFKKSKKFPAELFLKN